MYMTPEDRAEAREHADPEERYGFCPTCECNVPIININYGFDHEFGFHSMPTDVCPECRERVIEAKQPRFENVFCSQCGCDFGPGNSGFSHCDNHKGE